MTQYNIFALTPNLAVVLPLLPFYKVPGYILLIPPVQISIFRTEAEMSPASVAPPPNDAHIWVSVTQPTLCTTSQLAFSTSTAVATGNVLLQYSNPKTPAFITATTTKQAG